MNEDSAGKRTVSAWVAIVSLSFLWLFCLTLPLSMLKLAWTLFHGGVAGGGFLALFLAFPASWPLWRCSRAIRDYYTGKAVFELKLSVTRGEVLQILAVLAVLSFLAWNAVNYTAAARRKPASAQNR